MKKLLLTLGLFLGILAFAQSSTKDFKFANFKLDNEEIPSADVSLDHFKSFNSVSINQFLNFYISTNLDHSKIEGNGKSSTLLSLSFSEQGILENITAIGDNKSLNKEAEALFKSHLGSKMNLKKSHFNNNTEINIPITIEH